MYHYTESGLNNVWLKNGYKIVTTPYGKGVAIENVEGLHRSIALQLINNKPRLSGAEFRFLRKELDMSQATLAGIVGKDAQSVARWEKKGQTPKMADRMLRFVFQGYAGGDSKIKAIIERLNEIDQQAYAKMRFEKDGKDWKRLAA
ncbi:MAG: helix-turn-helix domain-containing protein [Alphaproteobacteria bacterium]